MSSRWVKRTNAGTVGRSPGAIGKYSAGCAVARQMVADGVPEAVHGTQLGAMLYASASGARGRRSPWRDRVAHQAEEAYVRLGEESAGLVADVVIRRALVHRSAGDPLSAMADIRGGGHRLRWRRRVGAPRDPSPGCWAWRRRCRSSSAATRRSRSPPPTGRSRRTRRGSSPTGSWPCRRAGVRFPARGTLRRCRARGIRPYHLAEPLLADALALDGEPWPEFDDAVARVRDFQPTLAAALHAVGHDDLARRLAEFKETEREGVILVPATRCRMHDAPAVARELVDAQTTLSIGVPEELLLGLEAHALFAEASGAEFPGLRDRFGEFGPMWAVAMMNFGQRMSDLDFDSTARDAARWLAQHRLPVQLAMIENSLAHGVVAAALDWLASADEELSRPGLIHRRPGC